MCRPVPGVHYRLNLKDIPFIIGTVSRSSCKFQNGRIICMHILLQVIFTAQCQVSVGFTHAQWNNSNRTCFLGRICG